MLRRIKVICLIIGLAVFIVTGTAIAKGKKKSELDKKIKTDKQVQGKSDSAQKEKEEIRSDQVTSVKQVQGRLDSVRKEKIVITYEPEEQEAVQLQTYYLRDENTAFTNKDEKELNPGDIVEITYQQSEWVNEKGKRRIKRTVNGVRFIRSRVAEELRKEAQGDLGTETERLSGNSGEVDDEI